LDFFFFLFFFAFSLLFLREAIISLNATHIGYDYANWKTGAACIRDRLGAVGA